MDESQRGTAENALYEAAVKGDVRALLELLENNPFLLDIVFFTRPNKTPLHVATMKGHLTFVRQILKYNSQLAEELDVQQSSALHIASAKGHVELVRELLSFEPGMCFSRDCQGRNPLHLAAMKGHDQVLKELVQSAPFAAREKLDGVTLLHMCIKYNQLEALKILVPKLSDLLDATNDDGDTILHMAVRDKQIETLKYLVGSTGIDVNAKNSMGQKTFDILGQDSPDTRDPEIRKILAQKRFSFTTKARTQPEEWLSRTRDSIMVVAVLMATMAFQAVVNPAGGVWQDNLKEDSQGNPVPNPHRAGEAVMAYNHPTRYRSYLRSNNIVFVSSLSVILLLISGLPLRRRFFMWLLIMTMWLTVTAVSVTYVISVFVVTPRRYRTSVNNVTQTGIIVWGGVMGIVIFGNTVRLMNRWFKSKGVTLWPPKRFRHATEVKRENYRQASV